MCCFPLCFLFFHVLWAKRSALKPYGGPPPVLKSPDFFFLVFWYLKLKGSGLVVYQGLVVYPGLPGFDKCSKKTVLLMLINLDVRYV